MAEGADQAFGIDWGLVGAVIGFAAISISLLLYQHRQLLDQLEDPADRARIRARLATDAGVARRFRDGIDGLIIRIDGYFGPSRSWRAFDRCLLHAYLYPGFLFMVAGFAAGTSDFTGDATLGEADWRQRLLVGLALVSAVGWAFLVMRSLPVIERGLGRLLRPFFEERPAASQGRAPSALSWLAEFLAFASTVAGAAAVAFAFAIVGAVAGGGAVAGAASVAGVVALAFAGAGAAAVAGTAAGAFAVAGTGAVAAAAAFVLVFHVILPVANAALDWLSWAVTRGLLRRSTDWAGATGSAIGIALRLAADLYLAFVSLCGLAVLLPNAIEATNRLLAPFALPTVAWLPLLYQALEAPFTAGFFVTGMLLTTLVPTLLHVVAGLFGVFAVWTWGGRRVAALIPADRDATMPTSDCQRIAWFMLRRRLWVLPSILACLPLVAGLAWLLTFLTGPIGLFLADLALCGTSWSHGLCPFWD